MTSAHPLPALAVLVTVVVDGLFVPTAPPPVLHHGRVLAGPALVARLADRTGEWQGGVWAERRGRVCSIGTVTLRNPPLIPLAPLARCLGASVTWDPRTKTMAIAFAGPAAVFTPAPYDPSVPRVAPTTIFTPEPAPPTPRATVTGVPRPRRTAVPAVPSWPLSPPWRPTTTPRPRSL